MVKKLMLFVVVAGLTASVQAEPSQSGSQNETAAPSGSVLPPDCKQPTLPPLIQPNQFQIDAFNKQMPLYKKCIEDYVDNRQKAVKQLSDQIKKNTDAANDAIKQFNDFNHRVGERQ